MVAGLLSKSVAGGINVVLTFTNGTANETDNAAFDFTGVLSGNIYVLLPSGKSKVFVASNSTTGAYTLGLGVNNGSSAPLGTTANLPQGTLGLFYSDGTNVYQVATSIFASPTFTGTATFPDGATWTSSGGIANLTELGIGMSPINILDIADNQNGSGVASILNNSAGASALASWRADNGTQHAQFGVLGSGYTTNGILVAGRAFISATAAIALNSGGKVAVGVNGSTTEVAEFNIDGSLLVGSTTGAGAGTIAATGNVISYYSDERLKTRLGGIPNALSIICALEGFYYEPNDRAVQLGYERRREVGVSAQQVQAVLPEAIARAPISDKAGEELMSVKDRPLIALLIEGIKEQQAQIELLTQEVDRLRRER